jgi:trans-AT polyketide synthase, acyltransferase and oxidoreductase domains
LAGAVRDGGRVLSAAAKPVVAPPGPVGGTLGCPEFRRRRGLRYAYYAGAMYKGIGSRALVVRMGRAGLLGFLGTGGLRPEEIAADLRGIAADLGGRGTYGANFLASPLDPAAERAVAELLVALDVPHVEAAAFTTVTPDLVWLRARGLRAGPDGAPVRPRQLVAKLSRPEVAALFLAPAPAPLLERLVAAGRLTPEEARLAAALPLADDLCVEADSGGHTDRGVLGVLLPFIRRQRDEARRARGWTTPIGVGAAGGLGTPEALAAAFTLGADFVVTGSVNQCTAEAGTSDLVKDLLQTAEPQDTDLVPAGDMFELGAKVQVFKRGLLFPGRAKKLHELYRQLDSLDQLDARTREQLETRVFGRPLAAVYEETKAYYLTRRPEVIARAEQDPKHRMALVFRWYFVHSSRLARRGDPAGRADFQIHCGPALGAFNQLVRGTPREDWRQRHVDEIAGLLMEGAAAVLRERWAALTAN